MATINTAQGAWASTISSGRSRWASAPTSRRSTCSRPHVMVGNRPIGALVFSAHGSDVDTVLVNGSVSCAEGRLVGFDRRAGGAEEAERRAAEVIERAGLTNRVFVDWRAVQGEGVSFGCRRSRAAGRLAVGALAAGGVQRDGGGGDGDGADRSRTDRRRDPGRDAPAGERRGPGLQRGRPAGRRRDHDLRARRGGDGHRERPVPNQTDVYRQFAAQGYDLVIGWGGQFTDGAVAAAEEFPDVKFLVVNSGASRTAPTSPRWTPAIEHWQFLAGFLLARLSETGTIGSVGGQCFPATAAHLHGTASRAPAYANPDIDITIDLHR